MWLKVASSELELFKKRELFNQTKKPDNAVKPTFSDFNYLNLFFYFKEYILLNISFVVAYKSNTRKTDPYYAQHAQRKPIDLFIWQLRYMIKHR